MMKFLRECRVEFYNITPEGTFQVIQAISELRIKFEVDKTDGSQMNHATLLIYNMRPTDRASIARPMPLSFDWRYSIIEPAVTVRIYVGYNNEFVHMYTGDILWAHTNRIGPDWVTQMELYTGLTQSTTPSQVSFSKPTSARVVLEAIAAPLEVTLRYTDAAAVALEGKQVTDYSGSGLAYREANQFLRKYGLAFTMEDEDQGLIYSPNSPRDPNQQKAPGNTFSPTSGLIGTPKITRAGVEIRSLLRPNMALMQRFFVESETIRGTLQGSPDYSPEYFASHIRHSGDNRGDEWYTDIEGFYARLEPDE